MLCKFVFNTDQTFFCLYICTPEPVGVHTHTKCSCGSSQALSVFSFLLMRSNLSGGMLVDQCVSEAVICLAAVLLWVGRWDGYPYPPSGQPGMDEMRSWPSAERDQGITVFHAIPAAQLFLRTCQIMSVPMWPELTSIKRGMSCTSPISVVLCVLELQSATVGLSLLNELIDFGCSFSHKDKCTGWSLLCHSGDCMQGSSGISWPPTTRSH